MQDIIKEVMILFFYFLLILLFIRALLYFFIYFDFGKNEKEEDKLKIRLHSRIDGFEDAFKILGFVSFFILLYFIFI